MVEAIGRLERRKRRTRQALIDAAVELFAREGYEGTTVAEIAAAADVSTRTFFLHFPSKEDVLFDESENRLQLWSETLRTRGPDETVAELLVRATAALIAHTSATDLPDGRAALRARLVASTPSLQSALVHRFFPSDTDLAGELCRACPELDRVEAAAAVGSVFGAVIGATLTAMRDGASAEETRDAMLRAASLAVRPPW